MNSALVEFEDGTKVVTSRYAVRKLTHNAALSGAEPALSAERPVEAEGRNELERRVRRRWSGTDQSEFTT